MVIIKVAFCRGGVRVTSDEMNESSERKINYQKVILGEKMPHFWMLQQHFGLFFSPLCLLNKF